MRHYVYWYHLGAHTDPETQGYVGITRDLANRHYLHSTGRSGSTILKKAFNKYGELIQKQILFTGTRKQCLEMEQQLRPKEKIGWNICIGGGFAPDCTGRVHSAETRLKISKSSKGKVGKPSPFKGVTGRYTDEQRKHLGSFHKGKKLSKEQVEAIRIRSTGSNSANARKVYLIHKDNLTDVVEFGSLSEAVEFTKASYSGLRSAFQRVNKTLLCSPRPSKQGWHVIHESKVDNPMETLEEAKALMKGNLQTMNKACGEANHASKAITMEHQDGTMKVFGSRNQAAKYIGLTPSTLDYHAKNAIKSKQDSPYNSKGWRVKYVVCVG